MNLEHVFSSTNRQPGSVYWVKDQPYFLTCSTRSIILHQIDHKHHHKTILVKNDHKTDITRICGDG